MEIATGIITASNVCEATFALPEFIDSKEITAPFNIIKENRNVNLDYDIIIGRNVLSDLGIILDFTENTIKWESQEIQMKDTSFFQNKERLFYAFYNSTEPEELKEMAYRAEQIADANYEKANLANIIHDNCSHLKSEEKNQLFRLLRLLKTYLMAP